MSLITAQAVREQAEAIAAWSRRQAESEAQRFTDRQPFVSGYVFATLEDEGQEATGFTLQLALTIDKVYRGVLGRAAKRITSVTMEAAASDAEQGFEQLVGVEPELALRRMLFQRDLGEPELLAELMRLMFEEVEQEPELEPAVGATFLALKAVALAYERANAVVTGEPKSSLGNALEAQLGRPLPKIGRNDPCPCGSGHKFKKCCGQAQTPAPTEEEPGPLDELGDSRTEQRFVQYINLVGDLLMPFYELLCRKRNGRWLRRKNDEFEERFGPGEPDGVPDSLHIGYLLLDLQLPESRKSVAQLFLDEKGAALEAPAARLLRDLIQSYPAFYEFIDVLPDGGTKRLRELGTDTEWIVGEVDDPEGTEGTPGEIWFCRFVGPRDDAVTFMTPLIFAPEARDELDEIARELMQTDVDAGLPPGDAIRAAMKREVPELAEFLLAAAPDLDEDADDDTPSLLDLESAEADGDESLFCDDPDCEEHRHLDGARIAEESSRDHFRRWLDMPLPALDGATPRQAAASAEGRARVAALLDEHNRAHPGSLPPIDMARLRRELKLDR